MDRDDVRFYAEPGPLTKLPGIDGLRLDDLPTDRAALRRVVQGLLVHRDWVASYGLTGDAIRLDEQNLRTTAEVLERAWQLDPVPAATPREPARRVQAICRHFALLHTAFLRAQGVAARVRCGFSNYFDGDKWFDHWVTEWWDGERWVREDTQIDDLQSQAVGLAFDPYDQPQGPFLAGTEAWRAARAGEVDPERFGILDMWGLAFIGGNVILDLACLNKVEMLPWDGWGMVTGPFDPVSDEDAAVFDDVAAVVATGDITAIRARYDNDDRLRVPPKITTVVAGQMVPAQVPV